MSRDPDSFARAARALLRSPFVVRGASEWSAIRTNRRELVEYFNDVCGWKLDVRASHARLYKRHDSSDPTRRLHRYDSKTRPFKKEDYALLCVVLAQLATRRTAEIGELANNVHVASSTDSTLPRFDPANQHRDRERLVQILRWLETNGFLEVLGDLDPYKQGNSSAAVQANGQRIALILSSSTAPSQSDAGTTETWIETLCADPHRVVDEHASSETITRLARHEIGRALLDNPTVPLASLSDHARAYLDNYKGREFLRNNVSKIGFVLEESNDVLIAVDPTGQSTDRKFGQDTDFVSHTAAVVLNHLLPTRDTGATKAVSDIETFVIGLLKEAPSWASEYQKSDSGGQRLTREALAVLHAFGLVTFHDHKTDADADPTPHVSPTAAAGRYEISITDSRLTEKDTDR